MKFTKEYPLMFSREPTYTEVIKDKAKQAIMNTKFGELENDEVALKENLEVFFEEIVKEYKEAWMLELLRGIPQDYLKEN